MIFPEHFVERLKAEWPESEKLRDALDDGDADVVFNYVADEADAFPDLMNPRDILLYLDRGDINAIRKAAEKAIRLGELFDEFMELCKVQGVTLCQLSEKNKEDDEEDWESV